uniref:Uncharacterized protein n=1 Tax=Aegilops tauschii subsp. strangulata TaxID=200361 RepID=A0A453HVI5_AEGTS
AQRRRNPTATSPLHPSRGGEGTEMVVVKVDLVHQELEVVRFARGDEGQFVIVPYNI